MEEGKPSIKVMLDRTAAITQYNVSVPENANGSSLNQAQPLMIGGEMYVLIHSPISYKERYQILRVS